MGQLLQTLRTERVVYKCPPGQVMILEDAGMSTEAKRCYTPGVSYVDHRPISINKIDKL